MKVDLRRPNDLAHYICIRLLRAFEDVMETPGCPDKPDMTAVLAGMLRPAVLWAMKIGVSEEMWVRGATWSWRIVRDWRDCRNPNCLIHAQARAFFEEYDDDKQIERRIEPVRSTEPTHDPGQLGLPRRKPGGNGSASN